MMQTEQSLPPKRKRLKLSDVIILVITAIIIGFLVHALVGYLSLNHEVSTAKATTDRVVTDMRKQNASDVYAVSDPSFKAKNSKTQLTAIFKNVAPSIAGASTVVHKTVANSSAFDEVSIIYQFAGKKSYFLRVIVRQPHGHNNWQLINLASDTTENNLL